MLSKKHAGGPRSVFRSWVPRRLPSTVSRTETTIFVRDIVLKKTILCPVHYGICSTVRLQKFRAPTLASCEQDACTDYTKSGSSACAILNFIIFSVLPGPNSVIFENAFILDWLSIGSHGSEIPFCWSCATGRWLFSLGLLELFCKVLILVYWASTSGSFSMTRGVVEVIYWGRLLADTMDLFILSCRLAFVCFLLRLVQTHMLKH